MSAAPLQGVPRLRQLLKQHGEEGWDKAWEENVTPWEGHNRDLSGVRPPLREVFESEEFPVPTTGRVLVPGCGRGFDAIYFARRGYESWGIDLSSKAVDAAETFLKSQVDPPSNVTFKVADFFTFSIPEGAFELVYDYTFFCALPPALRMDWGTRLCQLVNPGGYLIALVWPIDGLRPDGPPWSVSVPDYEEALGVAAGRWTKVVDKVSDLSVDMHKEREKVLVWRREQQEGVAHI